ncbi:protein snakeskin-like isoform X2 [Artemia franciscana]|uniref:protein snakeskin-like isoform X2 n=1 Tax=Artemia franciscana TaxID=6661 RepID=UPI0032DA1B7E
MASVTMLGKPHGILKFMELLIALVCVALLRHYDLHFGGELNMASFRDRYLVGSITIGGMILVTAPLIASYLFGSGDTSYRAPLEGLYGLMFFIIGISSGCLAIEYYRSFEIYTPIVRAGLSMGSLLIINSFFYLLDAVLAFQNTYGTK